MPANSRSSRKRNCKKMADPSQVVSDFIASLPSTIRNTVLTLVHVYVVRLPVTGDTNFETEIHDLLLRSGRTFGFGALLCVVAALDHILSTSIATRQAREETLADLGRTTPAFEKMALQAPLNSRHFAAAWRDWTALRNGALAPENLALFEKIIRTGAA
jgi:hypothetical protein